MNERRVASSARRRPAYCEPRLWKNAVANSGATAPSMFRMRPWPAIAEPEDSP